MKLEDYGFNSSFGKILTDRNLNGFEIGRVVTEHKERYIVITEGGEYEAEITGNMRFTAVSREDFPAVGDWVTMTLYDDDFAVINNILPRFSALKRQAVGQFGEIQLIAVNVDFAFLMQSVDRDFNINRLERYLTICNASKVKPVVVLSKIDLISESILDSILNEIQNRVKNIPVVPVSNETGKGYDLIKSLIEKGKTYCLLGSSGVGKSTLLNNLSGKSIMRTDSISASTNKGRHITSHRELILLNDGGILIDNPGMREIGITDVNDGLNITFNLIISLSRNCKYKDCTHTQETGCAVLEAVERNEIDRASYENYLKMEKEKAYYDSTLAERRKKDKDFGKRMKNYKKLIKKNKN